MKDIKDIINIKDKSIEWGIPLDVLEKMSNKELKNVLTIKETEKLYNVYKRMELDAQFKSDENKKEKEKQDLLWKTLKKQEFKLLYQSEHLVKPFAKFMFKTKSIKSSIESFENCAHGFIISDFLITREKSPELYSKIVPSEDYTDKKILTVILYWMYGFVYYYFNLCGDDVYKHLPLPEENLICDEKGNEAFLLDTYNYLTALSDGQTLYKLKISVISKDSYYNNNPGFKDKYPYGIPDFEVYDFLTK